MRSAHEILRKPRVTEKGSRMAEAHPKVVFEVPTDANKAEIENAVRRAFNVEVASISTMIVRGKVKKRGTGKRPNWKKAIVTLKEGYTIDFFGGAAA